MSLPTGNSYQTDNLEEGNADLYLQQTLYATEGDLEANYKRRKAIIRFVISLLVIIAVLLLIIFQNKL